MLKVQVERVRCDAGKRQNCLFFTFQCGFHFIAPLQKKKKVSNQENGYSRISISLIKAGAASCLANSVVCICGCVCVWEREKAGDSPKASAGTLHQHSECEINRLLPPLLGQRPSLVREEPQRLRQCTITHLRPGLWSPNYSPINFLRWKQTEWSLFSMWLESDNMVSTNGLISWAEDAGRERVNWRFSIHSDRESQMVM